jgi:hypothetical protein
MALEAFSLIGRVALEGADRVASGLEDIGAGARESARHVERFGTETFRAGTQAAGSMSDAERAVREMRQEMRQLSRENRAAMAPFRLEQMRIQRGFFDLARETENWTGTTEELMARLHDMGVEQRNATSAMTANNAVARMGFLQSVASMLAMKTQSQAIIGTYNTMGNSILQANNGLLQMSGRLESLAHQGGPQVLALRILGANASMSQLNSLTGQITQGLPRMAAVAVAAGVALGLMVSSLTKAAMGTPVAEVNKQIGEIKAAYSKALDDRRQELATWAGLFEEIKFKPVKPQQILNALRGQVTAFDQWTADLKKLAARGVDEGLIMELQKAGPKAGAEITALTKMTDSGLTEYVGLWKRKQAQASNEALSELDRMKQGTDRSVQQLKDSITPLAQSWEGFKTAWSGALQPFIESFGEVASKVVDIGAKVGEAFKWLNENNFGWVIKVAGWFVLLSTALTLILSPLAIGIGLIPGFLAGWAFVAPFIMPLITGLAAMSATVWIVVAAVIALVAIGIALYKNWDSVVAWLTAAWDSIKNYFLGFMPAIQAGWAAFTAWISGFWEGVKAVFRTVGTFLLNWTPFGWLIRTIMANMDSIKLVISTTLAMIKGLWTVAWNAIKAVFTPIINGIKTAATVVFNALKTYFTTTFNAYKTTFSTVFNAIKNTVTTIFNGIKTAMTTPINAAKTTISGVISSIKKLFTNLILKIPKPKIPIINVGVGHKKMAGVDIPYPKVSFGGWKAKGGTFDQPELVGIGESGREAIIPLENRKHFKPFAQAIAEHMAGFTGGTAGGRLEVPIYLNNREIVRAIIADLDKALAQRAKRSGGLVNRGNL